MHNMVDESGVGVIFSVWMSVLSCFVGLIMLQWFCRCDRCLGHGMCLLSLFWCWPV